MTLTTKESIAVLNEQMRRNCADHTEIKLTLEKVVASQNAVADKLERAISEKTDKIEFLDFRNRVYALAGTVLAAVVGLVFWLIQGHIK